MSIEAVSVTANAQSTMTAGDQKQPPFATVTIAANGKTPRYIKPTERAGNDSLRVRVSCHNYSPQPTKYVLVGTRDREKSVKDAIAFYRKEQKIDELVAKAKGPKGDLAFEEPEIVALILTD